MNPSQQSFYNRVVAGQLYLIGTPLGNLADFSPRAIETLRKLDTLYCEDTRHTGKLVSHFGIQLQLRALHDDSPEQHWHAAVDDAAQGRQVGYASDAGMPGVSDPGRKLLRAAWDAGLTPIVIPGPSATTTLVSYCPFVGAQFVFRGFVPRKQSERHSFNHTLRDSIMPSVAFESPQRILHWLDELCELLEAERELLIGRELTKMHEQVLLFRAADWPELRTKVPELGEFSIAVAAAPPREREMDEDALLRSIERLMAAGFSRKDALRALAACEQLPPNKLKALQYANQDTD